MIFILKVVVIVCVCARVDEDPEECWKLQYI